MNFKQFIPPIFIIIYKKIIKLGKKKYQIGDFEIEIPPGYGLPDIQHDHKLYDRFLPILVKFISSNKLIIDIGANIGDTAVSIVQYCENPIICCEPSSVFFPYLERNINQLPNIMSNRITVFNKFVGTGLLTGELDHTSWGTASTRITNGSKLNSYSSLDTLIEESSNVILVKVDTDGFDFDIIKSAEKILSNSEPILYWENQILEEFQLDGYNDLYNILAKHKYNHVFIFDNYGNLITQESNFETLRNLNSYVYSMDKYNCTRSIYYTDILATTDKNYLVVKNAIDEYKMNLINNKDY